MSVLADSRTWFSVSLSDGHRPAVKHGTVPPLNTPANECLWLVCFVQFAQIYPLEAYEYRESSDRPPIDDWRRYLGQIIG